MKMSVLSALITREEIRNRNMIAEYTRELDTLPKGSIKKKKVNGNIYYYLVFRNGNKIVSKYIGKDEESVTVIKEQILRRKQIEGILKKLADERNQIEKLEATL